MASCDIKTTFYTLCIVMAVAGLVAGASGGGMWGHFVHEKSNCKNVNGSIRIEIIKGFTHVVSTPEQCNSFTQKAAHICSIVCGLGFAVFLMFVVPIIVVCICHKRKEAKIAPNNTTIDV